MLSNTFLDPKNDIAFKKIFGSENNKDILIHFLNDMIEFREKKPIVDVEFLKNSQDPKIALQKTSIVDVMCKDESGNTYIVEMQVTRDPGFAKRAQYYAAKAYTSQMYEGSKYDNLKELIFLAILNFTMFPNKEDFKSDHVILDKKTFEHDLKDFSFTFLELPKFYKTKDELETMIDKWAYFFKYAKDMCSKDLSPKTIDNEEKIIKRAYEELIQVNWNKDELDVYESILKKQMDFENAMYGKFDEGKVEGEKIGIEKGERNATIQIVKAMIAQGLSIQVISSITKLSKDEIEVIRNN